jgi:hypothetical protein
MIDYRESNLEFKVGNFMLTFPTNVVFETFNDPENYYGVIFRREEYKYEVIDCKLGTRLLINGQQGEARDIPFNLGTANLLPNFIKVKSIKAKGNS